MEGVTEAPTSGASLIIRRSRVPRPKSYPPSVRGPRAQASSAPAAEMKNRGHLSLGAFCLASCPAGPPSGSRERQYPLITDRQAHARHAPSNSAAAKGLDGVFGHHGCQRGNRRAGRYCGINPYPQVIARQQRHTFLEVGWSGLAELNEGRTSPPVESRQNQVRLAVSLPPRSLASARKWNRRGAEASPAPWVLDCERVKSVCAVQP